MCYFITGYINRNKIAKFLCTIIAVYDIIINVITVGYENIKSRDDYVLSYNRVHRTANWVIEVIILQNTM